MKKLFTTLSLLTLSLLSFSQTLYVPDGTIGSSLNGNVGIGIDSPLRKLHIKSGTSNGIYDQYALSLLEGTDARLQLVSSNAGSNGSSISLTNENISWTIHQKTVNVGNRFDIGYRNSAQVEDIAGLQSVYFSILSNGKVGIGTTNPGGGQSSPENLKLQVNGDIAVNSGYMISVDHNYLSHGFLKYDLTYSKARFQHFGYYGHRFDDNGGTRMVIEQGGNVGIGTTNPQSLLAVNGTITSKEVIVTTEGWSDFVFNENFKLRKLEEVENFIEENNHLPDVPSEKEVLENGIALGEMDAKLLQKIEELTLYMIDINKEVKALRNENIELKEKVTKLETAE